MRTVIKLVLLAVFVSLMAGSASAAKLKKKPAGTYISTAKIEILSGDLERYQNAISFLDTLFLHYGPYPEGYYWMRKIYSDYVEKTPDLVKKGDYIGLMVAYNDSLHIACESKDVKKKYRKKCKKFIIEGDSTMAKYWQEFYNDGVRQLDELEQSVKDLAAAEGEEEKQFFERQLKALSDTCEFSFTMAIKVDPTDARPYVGLSKAYKSKGDSESSNKWMIAALDKTDDRPSVLSAIAYNYIGQDDYCKAIKYLSEFIEALSSGDLSDETTRNNVISNSYNLTICYNRCEKIDSAAMVYRRIIELDPKHDKALTGLGRYFSELARFSADSANHYRGEGDTASTGKWMALRDSEFDSALVYYKLVFDLKPEDVRTAEDYGILSYIRGNYEAAALAFERVTELSPDNISNWTSLGDTYINLREFKQAADAYEKVAMAKPDDRGILEQLRDLYVETKQRQKRKDIEAKLKAL